MNPSESLSNSINEKNVSVQISSLVIGLTSALFIITVLTGFVELRNTLNNLASLQEANYAAVHTANKVKENIEIPIQNLEPKETNRVIVKFKDEAKIPPGLKIAAEKANLEKAQGLKHVLTINGIDAQVYEVSEDDTASEVVNRILSTKKDLIEYAEVDMQFSTNATYIPNDPYYSNSWHWFISKTQANTAWDTTKGEGVTIAILDSGVNCSHPDLASNCVAGWNTYDNTNDTSDQNGHGTAVTGAAASVGDNTAGGVGVAFKSKIMPVRISDANGNTTCSALANGIVYAIDHGAKVASNSYKIVGCTTVNSAADYMASKGGLYVRAIGNDGYEVVESNPSNIIHVSATDENDNRTSWSNYGTPVDVAAPGINIYCTPMSGGYGYCWGTSLSVPIISGTLALMFSANPNLTADKAKSILFSTADDIGTPGWDMYYGHGRVNAAKAVAAALATSTQDTVVPSTPANLRSTALTSSSISLAWNASTDDNSGVAGYTIYSNGTKLATVAGTSYINSGLFPNTSYTYTVRAEDVAGNISGDSNPLSITTPDINFAISSHSVPTKTTTGATVAVTLTKPGTVTVKYGTTNTNLNSSVQSTTSNTNHSLAINNLNQRTTYYYQVVATDSTGNVVTSAISSFKTSGGKR